MVRPSPGLHALQAHGSYPIPFRTALAQKYPAKWLKSCSESLCGKTERYGSQRTRFKKKEKWGCHEKPAPNFMMCLHLITGILHRQGILWTLFRPESARTGPSHLMADDPVFVVRPVIRAAVQRTAQKFLHLILIQIHFADIIFIFFVIDIIFTGIAQAHRCTAFRKTFWGISKTNTIPSTMATATFTARNPRSAASASWSVTR